MARLVAWNPRYSMRHRVSNAIELSKQAKTLRTDGQMVLIDCSPNNRDVLLLAAMVADHVIVPTSVSGAEVNRLEATLDLLVEVEETRDKDLVNILLTRWNSNRVLSNEFLEAFEGYPILKHKISNRVKYQSEFGTSKSVKIRHFLIFRRTVTDLLNSFFLN